MSDLLPIILLLVVFITYNLQKGVIRMVKIEKISKEMGLNYNYKKEILSKVFWGGGNRIEGIYKQRNILIYDLSNDWFRGGFFIKIDDKQVFPIGNHDVVVAIEINKIKELIDEYIEQGKINVAKFYPGTAEFFKRLLATIFWAVLLIYFIFLLL